jgi:biopolymer transport protein ExbD
MTPLIDMAMLLIVFFVLVSQIGATDLVPMKLPKPSPSAASSPGREPRCVVNALSDGKGRVRAWRFAGQEHAPDAAGLAALGEAVTQALRAQPSVEVHLRADADLRYADIAPAIEMVGRAATKANPGTPARLRVAVQPEPRS